jgi:hypothetical protein
MQKTIACLLRSVAFVPAIAAAEIADEPGYCELVAMLR